MKGPEASGPEALELDLKVRPSGERGNLIVIKQNGKIKMKEVIKDYGTLWKVELEPAKVSFQNDTVSSISHWLSHFELVSDWLASLANRQ